MPHKLSDSVKAKRVKKASRNIEESKSLPSHIKRPMIEGLYRIGWDAPRIIKETGIPRDTVYRNIKRHEERGTCSTKAIKLDAITWARKQGNLSASKKFKVDQEVIKDWMARL